MPFRLKFSYTHVQRQFVSTKIRRWREASYSIYLSINDAQQDLRLDRLFYPKQEFNLSSRAIFRYTSLNFTMDKKEKKKYYAADRKRIELNFDRKSDLTRERERENFETQSSIDLPPECRLSLSSSVTLTRIESSPIDFMSSTVMYRYCCWSLSIGSSPATWTQRELMVRIVTRETGTLQEGPKKKGGLGGGERGKISLAHTHVSNSCTRKQYIYIWGRRDTVAEE